MKQIDMYFMRHGKKRDLQNIISPQIVLEELPKIEHGSVEDLLFNGITPRAIELIKEQGNSHLSGNHYDQVDLFTSLAYRTQITAQSFVAGAGLADVATLDTSNDLGYHNLGIDFNDPLFPYLDDSTREGQDTYIKEAMQQLWFPIVRDGKEYTAVPNHARMAEQFMGVVQEMAVAKARDGRESFRDAAVFVSHRPNYDAFMAGVTGYVQVDGDDVSINECVFPGQSQEGEVHVGKVEIKDGSNIHLSFSYPIIGGTTPFVFDLAQFAIHRGKYGDHAKKGLE